MIRFRSFLAPTIATVALAVAPPSASATTLVATVGPGATISLKTTAGVRVTSVRAGRSYTIQVHDRSSMHNFRLTGPGFTRQTSLSFVGNRTWTVTFGAGTWRYLCTQHPDTMRGSFRAR